MIRVVFISICALAVCMFGLVASTNASNEYSSGVYGGCEYGNCSISLSSESDVAIDVTPSGGATRCTVQNDAVTVTTGSSTGYTVVLNNGDTTTSLDGPGSETIASVSGTEDSPVVLSAGTWGYRVDGIASFGAGPTSPVTNAVIPVLTFAAAPPSDGAGGTIRYTESVDPEETATSVWYGICVDASTLSGNYTDSVLYTAVIN
jgi:hypothetical protein